MLSDPGCSGIHAEKDVTTYLLPKENGNWPSYYGADRLGELFVRMLRALVKEGQRGEGDDAFLESRFEALIPFDGPFVACEMSEEAARLVRDFDALLRQSLRSIY